MRVKFLIGATVFGPLALTMWLFFSVSTLSAVARPPASPNEAIVQGHRHHRGQQLTTDVDTITMVAVPSGEAGQAARAVEHLAALLEQETGYQVRAYLAGCYGAAVDALAVGNADIGWLPAVAYVLAHDRFGVNVDLVTQRFGSTSYRGQFLVRADSGIHDLNQLAGKNFAFVDPLSASGFLYPALYISNTQGIAYSAFFSQTVFAGSHSAVVTAVYTGRHEGVPIHGGATYEDARGAVVGQYPDVFTKVKVLTYTMSIPNDTVSSQPGLDPTIRQEMVDGLLQVANTSEGREVLRQLYGIDGLQVTTDSAYDVVRQAVAAFDLQYESCSRSTVVTPDQGGMLAYVDARGLTTTIQMPAGSVATSVQLIYAPIPAVTHRPVHLVDVGHAFELRGVISDTGQLVLSLQAPMTLSVAYAESDLGPWIREDALALYYWDGDEWMKEPSGTVDAVNNIVTARPDHLSRWAVLGETHRLHLPFVRRCPSASIWGMAQGKVQAQSHPNFRSRIPLSGGVNHEETWIEHRDPCPRRLPCNGPPRARRYRRVGPGEYEWVRRPTEYVYLGPGPLQRILVCRHVCSDEQHSGPAMALR